MLITTLIVIGSAVSGASIAVPTAVASQFIGSLAEYVIVVGWHSCGDYCAIN